MEDKNKFAIGVDLGGTNIKFGLISDNKKLFYKTERCTEAFKGVSGIISNIISGINELRSMFSEPIDAVGLGSPGPLDPEKGVIFKAPNLPGWENIPILKLLSEHLKLPIFIDNDANLAALGEWWAGEGQGYSSLICITLGTGIGGGVILDGKLYRGSSYTAGEIGHMTVIPDGPLCKCGNKGCLEILSSGPAMVTNALQKLKQNPDSTILKLVEGIKTCITPEVIYNACLLNDSVAIEVMRETGVFLGIVVSSLINLLNPQLILFSGGISKAGRFLMDPILYETEKRAFESPRKLAQIKFASLGNSAGFMGAAKLAFMGLENL